MSYIHFIVRVEILIKEKANRSKLAMLLHTSSMRSITHNAHEEVQLFKF